MHVPHAPRVPRVPFILGHRGYRARFPENTLLAFREALSTARTGLSVTCRRAPTAAT